MALQTGPRDKGGTARGLVAGGEWFGVNRPFYGERRRAMKAVNGLVAITAVLCLSGAAQAASITWTAAVNRDWDTKTANWKLSDGKATKYKAGDVCRIDDTTRGTILMKADLHHVNAPKSVLVDISVNRIISWTYPKERWQLNDEFGSGTITKTGKGTLTYAGQQGARTSTAVYNIKQGVFQLTHRHCNDEMVLGKGSTVNLCGGELFYNENWGFRWKGTDIRVTADSTLRLGAPSNNKAGWAVDNIVMTSAAGSTLTVIPSGGTFHLNNAWRPSLANDAVGKMKISGNLTLKKGSKLTLSVSGTQKRREYVLVAYTGGKCTGKFGKVAGLRRNWRIDYDGTAAHPKAIVLVLPPRKGDQRKMPSTATSQPARKVGKGDQRKMPSTATSQPARKVRKVDPARGKLGLAKSYLSAGKKEKAKKFLREIVEKYPKSPHAKKARELLAGL